MSPSTQYLEVLSSVRGYYKCPKDRSGKRLGPLVAYAGRDENNKQYVGDEYVNFAKGRSCLLNTGRKRRKSAQTLFVNTKGSLKI